LITVCYLQEAPPADAGPRADDLTAAAILERRDRAGHRTGLEILDFLYEERVPETAFPEAFRAWKARTKRFVPWLV